MGLTKEEFLNRVYGAEESAKSDLPKITPHDYVNVQTLDLHGLSPKDAVNVLSRKIKRVRERGVETLRVVHEKKGAKLHRLLEEFLSSSSWVKSFEMDSDKGEIIVSLNA